MHRSHLKARHPAPSRQLALSLRTQDSARRAASVSLSPIASRHSPRPRTLDLSSPSLSLQDDPIDPARSASRRPAVTPHTVAGAVHSRCQTQSASRPRRQCPLLRWRWSRFQRTDWLRVRREGVPPRSSLSSWLVLVCPRRERLVLTICARPSCSCLPAAAPRSEADQGGWVLTSP